MVQLNAEVKAQLEQVAVDGYNYWKENASAEQTAAGERYQ